MASKAEKTIERCKEICHKQISKFEEEYLEAEGNYRDLGYDRYYNKMERLKDEINKLECFADSVSVWRDAAMTYKHQIDKNELTMMQIKSLIKQLTDDDFTSPRIAELIEKFRRL